MPNKAIKSADSIQVQAFFNFSLRNCYILLAAIGFVFYANTLFNKYAFDDNLVIEENPYVQVGFSGIPKILTSDSYAGYFTFLGSDLSKGLSGGRYRPLSEITFAIEQQIVGNSTLLPFIRHLVNILAYIGCLSALFYFLENFLLKNIPHGKDIAFIAMLLFAVHPLHTEVVANIKSLDEILSLLFIMLTFIYSLKYQQSKRSKYLIIGIVSFFLALLSKEYAVTLLFFIPFLFYLLGGRKTIPAIFAAIPYYGVFAVYLMLRYNAVGFHADTQSSTMLLLFNNPYLYATHTQKIATEWFVLGKYIGLLFFPYPLSCDYSYYQIPYRNLADISVLLSIAIYIAVFVWGILLAFRKNVLSFAVFFFLINGFMVSNFLLDIGATMGERLVFHSSLGFVIILSYFFINAITKMSLQSKKQVVIGIMSVIGIVCFGETVIRNTQWKDANSLFIHDVEVSPNSALMNSNAGGCYLSLYEKGDNSPLQSEAYLDSARKCLFRALHFNPKNEFTYCTLGVVYVDMGLLDSAKYCYDMVEKLHPKLPVLKSNYTILSQRYFKKGLSLAKDNNPLEGIANMRKALIIDSTNESIWYDLGVAYYHVQRYDSERYAMMQTLRNKPDSFDAAGAKKYLQELEQMKRQ